MTEILHEVSRFGQESGLKLMISLSRLNLNVLSLVQWFRAWTTYLLANSEDNKERKSDTDPVHDFTGGRVS
jgi:hypothetical protein